MKEKKSKKPGRALVRIKKNVSHNKDVINPISFYISKHPQPLTFSAFLKTKLCWGGKKK